MGSHNVNGMKRILEPSHENVVMSETATQGCRRIILVLLSMTAGNHCREPALLNLSDEKSFSKGPVTAGNEKCYSSSYAYV